MAVWTANHSVSQSRTQIASHGHAVAMISHRCEETGVVGDRTGKWGEPAHQADKTGPFMGDLDIPPFWEERVKVCANFA